MKWKQQKQKQKQKEKQKKQKKQQEQQQLGSVHFIKTAVKWFLPWTRFAKWSSWRQKSLQTEAETETEVEPEAEAEAEAEAAAKAKNIAIATATPTANCKLQLQLQTATAKCSEFFANALLVKKNTKFYCVKRQTNFACQKFKYLHASAAPQTIQTPVGYLMASSYTYLLKYLSPNSKKSWNTMKPNLEFEEAIFWVLFERNKSFWNLQIPNSLECVIFTHAWDLQFR